MWVPRRQIHPGHPHLHLHPPHRRLDQRGHRGQAGKVDAHGYTLRDRRTGKLRLVVTAEVTASIGDETYFSVLLPN